MRALLVTNTFATGTNAKLAGEVIDMLSTKLDITHVMTSNREDAIEIGSRAHRENYDVVITLGGDGTANEVINGLMALNWNDRPTFASIPGGNANVLTRNLGFSREPLRATEQLIIAIGADEKESIGLGKVRAHKPNGFTIERYFSFNAGVGIDAEVLLAMHELRNRGKKVSDFAYARIALRRIFRWMKRAHATLSIDEKTYFFAFVLNLSPWTYVAKKAIDPAPQVTAQSALSIFASSSANANTFIAVLIAIAKGKNFRDLEAMDSFENRSEIHMSTSNPLWLQVDGEPLELVSDVTFTHHPDTLTVYQAKNL